MLFLRISPTAPCTVQQWVSIEGWIDIRTFNSRWEARSYVVARGGIVK